MSTSCSGELKTREAFASFCYFFNKNTGVFEMLMFELFTKLLLTRLLVLNNRAQLESYSYENLHAMLHFLAPSIHHNVNIW